MVNCKKFANRTIVRCILFLLPQLFLIVVDEALSGESSAITAIAATKLPRVRYLLESSFVPLPITRVTIKIS